MTESSERLARLRRKLATTDDPEDRADLEAAIVALEAQKPREHHAEIGGDAQVGASVAGDVQGDVVAPLFPTGASGNYIAGVINLYQQSPTAPQVDYDAALRRYLKHLYSLYAMLDLRGIDDRPMDMPLSEIYVSLNLHEPSPDALRGRASQLHRDDENAIQIHVRRGRSLSRGLAHNRRTS